MYTQKRIQAEAWKVPAEAPIRENVCVGERVPLTGNQLSCHVCVQYPVGGL